MFYEPNQIDVDVLIDRKFMLEIMENYRIKNDIYIDYYNYLSLIEYKCKNIKKFPLKEINENKFLLYELQKIYCSHSVKKQIEKILTKTQQLNLDILNVEETLKLKHPYKYKNIKNTFKMTTVVY